MLYCLLKHDIVRTSTQMLPAYLALLILNAFSLLFSHLCLLWTWPAGLLSSSFTPWTNSSMSDGFSLHHASLRSHSFTRHLWGFKDQKKKKEKEKQLAMSRRFFKSPAHHAEKTRLWEVINLWHAYKVVFVQGTTVNIFVLLCFFPPVGPRHPCSTADSSLCRLLLLGSAPQTVPWCTRWGTTTARRNQDCVHCS